MTVLPGILLILNPYILLPHKALGFVLLVLFSYVFQVFRYASIILAFICGLVYF